MTPLYGGPTGASTAPPPDPGGPPPVTPLLPRVGRFYGVDFSGAALAGRTSWVAAVAPDGRGGLVLESLARLGELAGTDRRDDVLSYLVDAVRGSSGAVWGLDFPFGLPAAVWPGGWDGQLAFVARFSGTAHEAGLALVAESTRLVGRKHVRRLTDVEDKAPFDPYHYRIIYQLFHGMRDVLLPLDRTPGTCVLPFRYDRLGSAERVVVEACPSSTLKAAGLPFHRYKQTTGAETDRGRLAVRRALAAAVAGEVSMPRASRLLLAADRGGDALDAVVAALGTARSWRSTDHAAVARHPVYPLEGKMYV